MAIVRTITEQRKALGSTIHLALVSDASDEAITAVLHELWRALLLFEKRCSRFLVDSELSQFNVAAGTRRPISGEFEDILLAAQHMARQTDGLFNPFVLPALQRAGYKHSLVPEYAADEQYDFANRQVVPADQLRVGEGWAEIPYGTAIDLGGCGKGYAGDMLADMADKQPIVQGYWFWLGGDIVTSGLDQNGESFVLQIATAEQADAVIAEVRAPGSERFAVATSTVLKRKGVCKGKDWHHIIDPRSGEPANSDVIMATACTDNLLAADVHASSLIVLGSTLALAYAEKQKLYDVLLQTKPVATGRTVLQLRDHIQRIDREG